MSEKYQGRFARRLEAANKRMYVAAGYMIDALEAILVQSLKDVSRLYPDCDVTAVSTCGTLQIRVKKDGIEIVVMENGVIPADQQNVPSVARALDAWTVAVLNWGKLVLPMPLLWTVHNGKLVDTRSPYHV